MADVADVVSTESEGAQEFERGHHYHEGAHAHLDRDGEHDDLAVREEDRASQQDAEDSAGCANGRNVGGLLAPEERHSFYDDVDQPGANSRKEVILQKLVAPPSDLQLAAEHEEHKHVGEDVPNGGGVVQK